tara:strand:+ start:566 stop:859 length:294 start_codon:yes stop_codon:yes gene_type:complete
MSFTIDTGSAPARAFGFGNNVLLDGVLDSLPDNASQEEIDAATALEIRRDIGKPKTAKSVRAHFAMHWHLIAALADRSPNLFDAIIEELHEQLIEKA